MDGFVAEGAGEGRYYMSLPNYIRQFKSLLGFKPYPGTLNLKIKKREAVRFINTLTPIDIKGFKTGAKIFGSLKCYHVQIALQTSDSKFISGAIVVPEKTRHKDIIEVIAPVCLRKKFMLKDNDKVSLKNA